MTNWKEGLLYEMNFQHFDPHLHHSSSSQMDFHHVDPHLNHSSASLNSSSYSFYDALIYGSSASLNPMVNTYDHYRRNLFVQNSGHVQDQRSSNFCLPHYSSNQVDAMGSNQSHISVNLPELKTVPDARVTDFQKKSMNRSMKGLKNQNIIKGQWAIEEDSLLRHLVQQYGVRKWTKIADKLPGRIGKQCRDRWHSHLKPGIKKDLWSEEEDRILIQAHREMGNKWAEIAKRLSGRAENTIKNHWNATKRKQYSKRKCRTKYPRATLLQDYIKSLNLDTAEPSAAETRSLSMVQVQVQPQPQANEFNHKNNINNQGFVPNYGFNELYGGGCNIKYFMDNYVSIANDHKSSEVFDDAPSASLSMMEVQPQQQAMEFNPEFVAYGALSAPETPSLSMMQVQPQQQAMEFNPEFVLYGLDEFDNGGCSFEYGMSFRAVDDAASMD